MDSHRIKVKNFVIAEVCFRKLGKYANYGNVVVDIDSYNFAGIITDDKIIGYYRNKEYEVHYYESFLDIQKDPITYQYMYRYDPMAKHINYTAGFLRSEDTEKDFTKTKIIEAIQGYEIEFIQVCDNLEKAKRVFNYNYNKKIIDVRY